MFQVFRGWINLKYLGNLQKKLRRLYAIDQYFKRRTLMALMRDVRRKCQATPYLVVNGPLMRAKARL